MTIKSDPSQKVSATANLTQQQQQQLLTTPRHVHVPDVGKENSVVFETLAFIYAVVMLCVQYINLYKTVWWLPHSNANYALNFYLIDGQLFALLVVIMSRRLCFAIFEELQKLRPSHSCLYWLLQLLYIAVCCFLCYIFFTCAYGVLLRHSLYLSLFLLYPLVTYVLLFRFSIRPFFGKVDSLRIMQAATSEKGESANSSAPASPRLKHSSPLSTLGGIGPILRHTGGEMTHVCSLSPEHVREEVDLLKSDFNARLKQILFDSMFTAYYMGCIPVCYAQSTLYYDVLWVSQLVLFMWLTALLLYSVHYLPLFHLNTLHRASLHLGHWARVEGRNAHVPFTAWSELQIWQRGSLVKHVRGLFRAEGMHNSAEPGNKMHSRFYFVFHQPLRVISFELVMMLLLVIYQFLTLFQSSEWNQVLSLAFLLFSNYYSLFVLARDRFVLGRAHSDT